MKSYNEFLLLENDMFTGKPLMPDTPNQLLEQLKQLGAMATAMASKSPDRDILLKVREHIQQAINELNQVSQGDFNQYQ